MIDITQAGAVATLTLGNIAPLSRHEIGFALQLRDAVRDTADSDEVKAIVIRVAGADFAAPPTAADLHAATQLRQQSRQAWHAAYAASSGLYQTIAYCKKFTVTAVQGRCAGAGSLLVLCSDHTVCAQGSSFEAPFAILPESNLVLAALTLRLNRTKSWMLGGQAWSAQQAVHAGLVNRVVAPAEVDAASAAAAHAAAKMPLDGVAMTKLLFEAYLDTQGIGQDFDMAGFYADSLQLALGNNVGSAA